MGSGSKIRAVICDLDGTLVDSAEDLRVALNVVMQRAGLREIASDEIRAMIGDGVPKLVERGLDAAGGNSGDAASLVPEFLTVYEANPTTHTHCYPGVAKTLAALKDRQCELAVVTNKPAAVAQKILQQLFLANFFAVVIGGESLPERKPHPAPLLEAARQLSLPTSDLLMVGDNIHDIEAARAARVQSVAVTYGYHHRPPSSFGADYLIDRFTDLVPLIDGSTDVARNWSSAVVVSFF